jgi:hypothetical protein
MGPRRTKNAGFPTLGLVVGLLIGAGLVGSSLALSDSSTGRAYASEAVSVVLPTCPNATGTLSTHSFDGAIFTLQVQQWCSPGGGALSVSGTEPSGVPFNLTVAGGAILRAMVEYSPDQTVGISWGGAGSATLYVS